MARQPAFANLLANTDVIHVRDDLEHERRLFAIDKREWSTVVPTDDDHDWRCCAGRSVVIHGRTDEEMPRQIVRDGADFVAWVGHNAELYFAHGEHA